ncbi:MAG TPA: hypothetical protein VJA26_14440, partial [Gammaproteobacteria bacterium]|nr:hypothetical protein [Gammaproteobacteria bacterium]
DRFADRMYAADMGGQVWRFDIANANNRDQLVRGGMIAQLGGAPAASPPYEDTRRFYYSPDVALVSNEDHSFMHIGIGSGHRAGPNSMLTHDRFYALRDHNPFTNLTQVQFNARESAPIRDADLQEIRDVLTPVIPIGAPGWRMELRVPGSTSWIGEKVLAESRTFANRVFFTTFTPGVTASLNDCTPRLGTNRLYIVDLFTGAPVTNLDGSVGGPLTLEDRSTLLGGSIASEVVFLFPSPDDANCVGAACTPPPVACVDLFCFPPGFANDPIRTFWSQETID